MPAKYHGWTGEIDIVESRGNREYVEQIESTLHFGNFAKSIFKSKTFTKTNERGFDQDFYKYEIIWNQNGFKFLLNGKLLGSVPVNDGYWKQTGFAGRNPWAHGSVTAPFDQQVSY